MIIKNIGYMWHRKYVDWQHDYKLIGYPERGKERPVDFAYQAGIYVLYNHNADVLYVGQAGRGETTGLYHRLKDHTNDELFCLWERFTWFGFYSVDVIENGSASAFNENIDVSTDVNELMNVIESLIIRVHRPPFNKSVGHIHGEKDKNQIEWFYQKAEFDEREEEFEALKKKYKSLIK
jgi:hypothetical protein